MPRQRAVLIFALPLFLAPLTLAQTQPAKVTIPDRTVFRVLAANKLDTRRAHPGDKVKMRLASTETLDDGVKIPEDSLIEGSIVEVAPYTPSGEARLSLIFDRIRVRKTWVPLHAFLITQGVLRRTVITNGTNNPCFDPFKKRSPHDDVYCDSLGVEEPRATGTGTISSDTPVLQDTEIVLSGRPITGTTLVCRKHDIVIEPNMAFLIRHISPK